MAQRFTESTIRDPQQLTTLLNSLVGEIERSQQQIATLTSQAGRPRLTASDMGAVRDALQALGSTPLNVANLKGILAQSQRGFAVVASSVTALNAINPTLYEVGTLGSVISGTTITLYEVIEGTPRKWQQVTIAGGSAPTDMMTTDTAQVAVSAAKKMFRADATTTGTPQRMIHIVGGDGQVAAFPTISARAHEVIENNANIFLALVCAAASTGGLLVYGSGDTATEGEWAYDRNARQWVMLAAGVATAKFGATSVPQINGLTTAGQGVPPILAAVTLTGQTAAIGTTTLYAVPAGAAGFYRISGHLAVTTTGNAVSLALTLGWTENGTAYTQGVASIASCAVLAVSQGSITVWCDQSTNITYSTALGGAIGAGVYRDDMTVERLM